jgi:hypothetical protein
LFQVLRSPNELETRIQGLRSDLLPEVLPDASTVEE